MRIEDAGVLLDNGDGLVVCLDGVESVLMVTDDSSDVQSQILRVHLRRESVWNTLLFAWPDLHAITDSGQVPDEARACWVEVWGPKTATSKVDCDRLGFIVTEGEDSLRWLSIDELHTEYLGSWKIDIHGNCYSRALGRVLDWFGGILS